MLPAALLWMSRSGEEDPMNPNSPVYWLRAIGGGLLFAAGMFAFFFVGGLFT